MFRLIVAILAFLMFDWVFFDGEIVFRKMAAWVEAGAAYLADLVFSFF